MKIETRAGQASESDTYARLLELLTEAQECCYLLGHLRKANDDSVTGQGFLAIGEMFKLTIHNITKLAIGKTRLIQ